MTFTRARFGRTLTIALTLFVAAGSLLVADSPRAGAASGWSFNRTERCLMDRINRARARRGLARLDRDKQLGYAARRHARKLARYRSIWHDRIGRKVTRWRRLGQNSGRAYSCRSIFRMFMRSSTHRSNILGAWRYMGVGTSWGGRYLYVQQIFESRRDPGNIWHYP